MRLVTRGDLDGLACAVVISACEEIEWVRLVHPQQIANRELTITSHDILANLPFHPQCGKWFDNSRKSSSQPEPPAQFVGSYREAPSSARVVYDYYLPDHPELDEHAAFIDAVDRLDSGDLTREDVEDPRGYILLGYTLDPRSGLGAFEDYFHLLLESLQEGPLEEILKMPEVVERVQRMREQDEAFREITRTHSRQDGNVVITDFRPVYPIPPGNRFLVYTLFPEAVVSIRLHWGPAREEVIVAVGNSVLNRSGHIDVGSVLSRFGGGGHPGAGSCVFKPDEVDARLPELVRALENDA